MTVRLQLDFRNSSQDDMKLRPEDNTPPEQLRIGITKQQFFETLHAVGAEPGMRFPVAFMESCRRTFDPRLISHFPVNIDRLYASGDCRRIGDDHTERTMSKLLNRLGELALGKIDLARFVLVGIPRRLRNEVICGLA